jgi:hypothetical protein
MGGGNIGMSTAGILHRFSEFKGVRKECGRKNEVR